MRPISIILILILVGGVNFGIFLESSPVGIMSSSLATSSYILQVKSSPESGVTIEYSIGDFTGSDVTTFNMGPESSPFTVTLTAPEVFEDWTFSHWKLDGESAGSAASLTVFVGEELCERVAIAVYKCSVEDSACAVVNATEDSVYFIYPNYEGDKPPTVQYALLSDWAATGFIIGMCKNIQCGTTDTDHTVVNSNTGAIMLQDEMVVLFGGPVVNVPVKYYEKNKISSVYYKNVKGVNYWYTADGERLGETGLTSSQMKSGQDMFVIESFIDSAGNKVFVVYGYGWRGTFAAGQFFKFVVYPDIESYTDSYYVFKWVDSDGDGFIDLDEIDATPIVSG